MAPAVWGLLPVTSIDSAFAMVGIETRSSPATACRGFPRARKKTHGYNRLYFRTRGTRNIGQTPVAKLDESLHLQGAGGCQCRNRSREDALWFSSI